MMRLRRHGLLLGMLALAAWLAGCAPVAAPTGTPPPTPRPNVTAPQAEATGAPTQAVAPTNAPVTQTPPPGPTPTSVIEPRVVELEWPPQMRLGESDVVRLALVPSAEGYEVVTEFDEHTTLTRTVVIEQMVGYELWGVAQLDGSGFALSPEGQQPQRLLAGTTATWRWSLRPLTGGQHRLTVLLRLQWLPLPDNPAPPREVTLYDRAVTVQVRSFLGLTTREAAMLSMAGLAFGSTLSLPLAAHFLRPRRARNLLRTLAPNPGLVIERPPGLALTAHEINLLRALFKTYGRLVIESEFRSGYSGARTFLALPIRPDGRADAYTIAKLGATASIRQEYENYEAFVKDTLPPVTARIQSVPVMVGGGPRPRRGEATAGMDQGTAALRYTFIGEPGRSPQSLRQALLADPDPALLEKLFATFGPNWWRQRRPYTFRLACEYDRMLPTHYVLEPVPGAARPAAILDGRRPPAEVSFNVGELVTLRGLVPTEVRPDGRSLALAGTAAPGHPPLRARWLSLRPPEGAVGRIVATRTSLLRDFTAGMERHGLPDPLHRLPELLAETVIGTQSTIHGDLNLENVLVGPGGFVWLIDFAQTRDGHPLFDFAHLEAGIIAHILSPAVPADANFLALLAPGAHPLLAALRGIVTQCLFDPSDPREYHLALLMACLGSLKYTNLEDDARRRLYLTAAYLAQSL